jgi:hypothetical protein
MGGGQNDRATVDRACCLDSSGHRHARQVKGVVIKNHRVLVNRAEETTETLIATDTTEKNFMIISVASVVLSAFSLERKIETTDFTDYTDYERVMHYMLFIIRVSLRLDR